MFGFTYTSIPLDCHVFMFSFMKFVFFIEFKKVDANSLIWISSEDNYDSLYDSHEAITNVTDDDYYHQDEDEDIDDDIIVGKQGGRSWRFEVTDTTVVLI